MILAAGRGERMRPLTDRTPKSMLQAGGKPLIFWHLDKLAQAGFGAVVINHAHLGEQIESAVGNGHRWHLTVRYSPEMQALETAGGIRNALALLGEPVFAVVNADVYSDYDYARLAKVVREMKAPTLAHLVLVDNPPHHPHGDFCLQDTLVREGGESLLTFSGIGAYRATLFDPVVPGSKHALAPLLRAHMASGRITGEHHFGQWDDIGTPQRLAQLDARLQRAPQR
ncbi:MAG: N-acetylmuramate alpha-1-phosphate uridylyltransferase MurU [Betaproteobacteria bacterium]|jgi:MurNAc alpha-1-phosphate uridylyltransferase